MTAVVANSQVSTDVRRAARRRVGLVPWLLLAPSLVLLLPLLATVLLIIRLSFGEMGHEWTTWSLDNYRQIATPLYLGSILLTFRLALISTFISVLLACPVAMVMATLRSTRVRRWLLLLILMPLLMNLVLQSYGWLVLLSPSGLVNRILLWLGLINHPLLLLYNESAVTAVLVQTAFPLAVLPIANAVRAIPPSLQEAAALLGANRIRVLRHIVLPLSAPGIIGASLLVFAFNVGAFVIPFLIGGRRVSMLAVLIRDQMGPLLNWPFGAANSVVLVAIALIVLGSYRMLAQIWARQ